MKNPEIIKQALCKKEGRRIVLVVLKDGDEIAIHVETKRLVDKKRRHIVSSSVMYGYETLAMLQEILGLLFDDPDFNALTNKIRGQELKNKWKLSTDIEH